MTNGNQKYTKWVALSMVIANMIGVGVFTSLGFQVDPLPSGFAILMLWLAGGVIALSGAFVYAEVATTLKKSGGEYIYLSKIYHPIVGFLSGWASLIVGFAGAICAVALGVSEYFAPVLGIDPTTSTMIGDFEFFHHKWIAILCIAIISGVHIIGVKTGGMIQNVLTSLKILLIAIFCLAPFFVTGFEPSNVKFTPQEGDWELIFGAGFAVSLAWVMYAYSGWNASAYIAGNLEEPKKSLPFSLIGGTLIVTIIYLLLNAMFMYTSNFSELAWKADVGNVVALKLFGKDVGTVFSGLFSLALISSLSAMVIAGPKVTEAMGKDYSLFKQLTVKSKGGTPKFAIIVQAVLAILLVTVSTFQEMIKVIAVALTLFSLLTVIGVFILRYRKASNENTVKTWGYPVTPLVFIAGTGWMIYYFIEKDVLAAYYGKAEYEGIILTTLWMLLPGIAFYFLAEHGNKQNTEQIPTELEEEQHEKLE
jgi:APA family basic amino acid/polyamine antiporter